MRVRLVEQGEWICVGVYLDDGTEVGMYCADDYPREARRAMRAMLDAVVGEAVAKGRTQLFELKAQLDAARAALRRYGMHRPECELTEERDAAYAAGAKARQEAIVRWLRQGDVRINTKSLAHRIELEFGAALEADGAATEIDLALLAKFASGEGGRRTGALMRAGLIEVRLTDEGRAVLAGRGSP